MADEIIDLGVILIIDDRSKDLNVLLSQLELSGCTVILVKDLKNASRQVFWEPPDLILVDSSFLQNDKLESWRKFKHKCQERQISIILIVDDESFAADCFNLDLENLDYLVRSNPLNSALSRIDTYLELQHLRKKLQLREQQLQREILTRQHTEKLLETVDLDLEARISRTLELSSIEEVLETENQKLRDFNQDLEDFAGIVAHDLQAPLRSLTMFSELLAKEFSDKLNPEAISYINRITDGGSRMQTFIQDVLTYSRAGKNQQTWVYADLQELVANVMQNLQAAIVESNAIVEVNNLPRSILVNPTEIAQLFQNLIDNSLKFKSDRRPQIQIQGQQQSAQWLISIRDNGIGIQPQFHQQIFQIFQRLHSPSQYPGTGIGLSICQKIVSRHHGKIWLESQLGEGSIVYFTLPVSLPVSREIF
jgi:light-regulated signal transduction histidine kinase (bacteriophytochrome)